MNEIICSFVDVLNLNYEFLKDIKKKTVQV